MQWTEANCERCSFAVGSTRQSEEESGGQQDVIRALQNLSHADFTAAEMLIVYLRAIILTSEFTMVVLPSLMFN